MKRHVTLALALCVPASSLRASYDVIIYGATPAGIQAALAASNEGRTALLATPQPLVGGMMSGGLGKTDAGNPMAIGGASAAFFSAVCAAYNDSSTACYMFEPHVAENLFTDLLAAAAGRVDVALGTTLTAVARGPRGLASASFAPTAAAERARSAAALAALPAAVVAGAVFIDATYEGDLLAAAGLTTAVGRESNATYNESHAGVLPEPNPFSNHQFKVFVDPLNASTGAPLKWVSADPPAPVGSGDDKVEAYNFRLCMTRNASNLAPFPRPADYDPADWELARRYLKAANVTSFSWLMTLSPLPHGKTDTNNNGSFSTDAIGLSWAWPRATPAERADLFAAHASYTQGFVWFLQHDPDVPASVAAEAREWGLAADEFRATANWPPQLYVREGRRLIGDFVFRQQDRQTDIRKNDSIGLFSYQIDSHNAHRYVSPTPPHGALNEGDFELYGGPLGQMPYRVMLPARAEAAGANVLAPVPLSASHMGYGCLRVEPQLMILGQAAGVAAAHAIADAVAVQDVDVGKLQARLRALGAKIDLPS